MQRQALVDYCLTKDGAWSDETSEGHLEVKVGDQPFALFGPESGTLSLKCGQDGEEAAAWRMEFPDDVIIMPYLGHFGWNTFAINGDIDEVDFFRAIDTSYQDVKERNLLLDPGTAAAEASMGRSEKRPRDPA